MKLKARQSKTFLTILSLVTIIFGFQNCGKMGEAAEDTSQLTANSTTPSPSPTPAPAPAPTPTPGPGCAIASNAAPTITSLSSSAITYNMGQGTAGGTDATKRVTVNVNSNDANSAVISIKCTVQNNAGLKVTCNQPSTPIRSGSTDITINADDGQECRSGAVSVQMTVTDAVVNATGTPIAACSSMNQTSAQTTLTVAVINVCPANSLMNPSPAYESGQMGAAVAIDGNWAVSVAPRDGDKAANAGAAYVMQFNGTAWTMSQKLMPSSLAANDQMTTVALSGNYMVLGAPLANSGNGKAWIYQLVGGSWQEVKALTPPAAGAMLFGGSVAVSNGIVAVGAPWANLGGGLNSGAVYLYTGAAYDTVTALQPSGTVVARGEFGTSLSYLGTKLAVGAPFPNSSTSRAEAVYIFDGAVLVTKISNPSTAANANDRFGFSVAMNGTNLLVGAPFKTSEQGVAYLYAQSGAGFASTPALTYKAKDPSTTDVDHFGYSVALNGTRVIIAAPDKAESAPKFGAVYQFATTAATQLLKIREPIADRAGDSFGFAIGLSSSGWMISGALNADPSLTVNNSGSTYFFKLP